MPTSHPLEAKGCSTFISVLFAIIVPTVFALLIKNMDRDQEEEHFYLDLTTRAGFACPEVTNFVSEFDPFYKWALGSSLPNILSSAVKVEAELASSAYQQASVWRVISNWTSKDGANNLYASAEPHIAGGSLMQHRNNWLWRLPVDLGISVRMCLSGGMTRSNRSCLWTTPVLATKRDEDLGLLLIAIPYRAASKDKPTLSNMRRSKAGSYLANYASNARTDFTKSQMLDESGYYMTDLPSCGYSPSYYTPDAMTYLAFSGLQCGCSSNSSSNIKVCVVATMTVAIGDWGLVVPGDGCDSLKSYWAWDAGDSTWLTFNVYNASSDKGVPFTATFTSNKTRFNYSISSIRKDDLRLMESATACVEASILEQSEEQIVSKCGTNELQLSTEDAAYYLGGIQDYIWAADPPKENSSSSCLLDLPSGQLEFRNKLCVRKLDKSISDELKMKIQTMLEARDVNFKMKKFWKATSDARHAVYASIFTGFVSLVGAIATLLSDTLEHIEDWIVVTFKKVNSCYAPGILVRIFFRGAALIASAVFLLLYPTYSAIKGVQQDRDFLQAQTVPQVFSDGSVMLLTTTATSLVEPIWKTFWLICVLAWIIVTITVFRIEHTLAKKGDRSLATTVSKNNEASEI